MKVFVITSRKGGVGKTTHAGHIGVCLAGWGFSVVLVDTDPHAGLTEWWNDREAEQPQLLSVSFDALPESLELLKEAGADFVIIDTPGQASEGIAELMKLADLVIIPSKASGHDLRAVRRTVEMVEDIGKPMVFVLNEVRPRTKLEGEAIRALAEHGKLAPVVHYRQDIITGMLDGRTIQEIAPSNPGTKEIKDLSEYLLKQVGVRVPNQGTKQPRKQAITHLGKEPTKEPSSDASGQLSTQGIPQSLNQPLPQLPN